MPKIAAPEISGASIVPAAGTENFGAQSGRFLAQDEAVADKRHGNAACHDEDQCRIPCAGEIEKALNHRGVGHAGEAQSETENETRRHAGDRFAHVRPHKTWRTTKTVTIAVATKVATAAAERGDSRDMPQMPWPEVQPLPSVTRRRQADPRRQGARARSSASRCGCRRSRAPAPSGAKTSPRMKAIRQVRSSAGLGGRSPATMPLTPAMRPENAMSITAEAPIRPPPMSARI